LSQELGGEKEETLDPKGIKFKHPVDIGDDWKLVGCYECHTGVNPLFSRIYKFRYEFGTIIT